MNDDQQPTTPPTINQNVPDFTPPAPGARVGAEDGAQMRPPKKSNKKKILLTILLLLLLAAGAVAAYLFVFKKDATAPEPQAQQTQEEPVSSGPQSLIFYETINESPTKLNSLTLTDGKVVDSKVSLDNITHSDVNKETVAIVGRESGENAVDTLLLSNDAGKTYKKIWEAKTNTLQTTSIKLSGNNEKLAISILDGSARSKGNTTYEISLTGNNFEPNPLFTSESVGVFLHGYNTETQTFYFSEGCFNCGARGSDKVYQYNISSKSKETLVESEATIEYNNVLFTNSFTTMTFLENSYNEQSQSGMEPSGPYVIKTFDIVDDKLTTIKTVGEKDKSDIVTIGKVEGSEVIYYTFGKQVVSLNDAKETILFESSQPVIGVTYVSDKVILAQTGTPEKFNVVSYTIESKASKTLLENKDLGTVLVGTTYK